MPSGFHRSNLRSRATALLRIAARVIALPIAFGIAVEQAEAGCKPGYVWRDAQDGDGACVTPAERAEAKAQNANAANNRKIGGGAYGPNTCRDGYVWREAFAGDVVCVTPHERANARRQNAASPQHTTN